MTRTDLFALIGLLICGVSFAAPETVANYSRERWRRTNTSWWRWKRLFAKLVMQPWYPAFVRFYGLFGLVFFTVYLVFGRHSK